MKKIIINILLICLMLTMASCGTKSEKQDHLRHSGGKQFQSSAAIFSDYIEEFEWQGRRLLNDTEFSVGDIPINFAQIEESRFQAVCRVYSNGDKEIFVRKSWWNDVHRTESAKESLIFHELGHCRLSREHDEKIQQNSGRKIKLSVMHSEIINPHHYQANRMYYISELFTQNKSNFNNF